ncbi:MAG: Gfo/Idh/MocA family oxidoreductase [Chitinophagaceae bacterium]
MLAGGLYISKSFDGFGAMHSEKINIGIIGCGDRGKGIMSVMKDLSDIFNVVAICDVLDFRFAEAKKIMPSDNIKTYTDYRRLLDDKNVHAVVNATPLFLHFQISSDALKAGKAYLS